MEDTGGYGRSPRSGHVAIRSGWRGGPGLWSTWAMNGYYGAGLTQDDDQVTVDTATAPAPPILQRPAPPRPAPPVLERPAPPRPPPPPPARPAPKKKHHGVLGSVLHVVESVAEVAAPIAATAFTGPAGGAAVMAAEGALKAAHATGGAVAVAANPVWLQLASVLGEVTDGFRISGTPLRSDQQTFLRVVDHLSQLVNGLALAPDDPELHAEFHEITDFLDAHPDSDQLAGFVASHPAIAPLVEQVTSGWR